MIIKKLWINLHRSPKVLDLPYLDRKSLYPICLEFIGIKQNLSCWYYATTYYTVLWLARQRMVLAHAFHP